MLQGYDPNGFFDEMFATPTEVRRHYERFRNLFEQISPAEFDERRTEVDLAFMRQGVTFNVYGDSQGAERIFPFDLVPRIISAKEWEYLERGLIQRITALNLFLHDLYHEQRIVHDGVIPAHLVYGAKNYADWLTVVI